MKDREIKSQFGIVIRPMRLQEIRAAKYIILSMAYRIYGWEGGLEASIRHFESVGQLADMDAVETYYFQNDGILLAVLDGETVIGSGAIGKMDSKTAELKRMWLLEAYQGRHIGYQVMLRLLEFARSRGYERVRLQTSLKEQVRAVAFYRKIGFYEIPCYNDNPEEFSMEIKL